MSEEANPGALITDDAARLSSKVKSHLPGTGKEVKTEGKVLAAEAGAKFDDAVSKILQSDFMRLLEVFTRFLVERTREPRRIHVYP